MKKILKKATTGAFALITILGSAQTSQAQLNPLGSQYFQNQYLANPAMAATSEGLTLSGGLRKQWSMIPGSPVTGSLTGEYRLKEKVGIGMNLYNEEEGLIQRTRMVGTYAYHLPLNTGGQSLHFGVSLGFANERVMNENLNGDQGDQSVGRFNQRETFVDGDFGVAYTGNRLSVQAALPNLKSFFGTDENNMVDRATFYSAVSYKWFFGAGLNGATLEPKAAMRGVKGYKNLFDAGANLTLINNQLILSGMYHSSESATFGIGVNYKNALSILGMYTTETAALRGYTSGNFEVGVRYNFLKK
ncbi:MAG TPA: PorP/SprF family type IX secretion system membrane protein [Sphingobacteriaceae bacterium]